ncbi:MAG: DNA polymerase IV [Candidatus Krumholzibacteria bacterium]|nr:DNA polymerase IV [Candidatus Krumholzibacteria bacterium]
MKTRTILHVDMDAFYASIEMLEDPALRDKPVIVGGIPEKRGVVAAASYEVRKYGVHSAMSSYQAKKLCPQAIFISPRMGLYARYSKRIFAILREYTPLVEPISIDEAFLDVTGSRNLFGPGSQIGRTIKRRIREELGLTASIGVATNKFLAKLASDLEKPDGFVVIPPETATARLADLPVGKLWGVGQVLQRELARQGVHKIRDLLVLPVERLEAIAGSHSRRLRELARGIDTRPVVVGEASKSIGAETTFTKDISETRRLFAELDALATRVAKRLRKEGYRAHTIQLKARYADFTTVTRAVTIPVPSASTQTLMRTARDLLQTRLDRHGRPLRLLGVSASGLVRPAEGEPELFPDRQREQDERVDHLLDALQDKYGAQKIWRGYQRREEDA